MIRYKIITTGELFRLFVWEEKNWKLLSFREPSSTVSVLQSFCKFRFNNRTKFYMKIYTQIDFSNSDGITFFLFCSPKTKFPPTKVVKKERSGVDKKIQVSISSVRFILIRVQKTGTKYRVTHEVIFLSLKKQFHYLFKVYFMDMLRTRCVFF